MGVGKKKKKKDHGKGNDYSTKNKSTNILIKWKVMCSRLIDIY